MFWSYLIRVVALAAILTAFSTACRRGPNANSEVERPALEPPSSGIPFETTEPETFQADVVVIADGAERKYFVARSGTKRRSDFDTGKPWLMSSVADDRRYLIVPKLSIYAVVEDSTAPAEDDWTSFLTTRWLNSRIESRFEKIETADGSTQYRATFGDEGRSEAIITIDPANGLPVRQEFFSIAGDLRTPMMTIEIRNFKPEAGDELFAIPSGFEKVDRDVLLKRRQELEGKSR